MYENTDRQTRHFSYIFFSFHEFVEYVMSGPSHNRRLNGKSFISSRDHS